MVPTPKINKIENAPARIANGAEDEQCYGCRARQSVDNADQQWPQRMKQSQMRDRIAQPLWGGQGIGVMFLGGGVRMPMVMHVGLVLVEMRVFAVTREDARGKIFR